MDEQPFIGNKLEALPQELKKAPWSVNITEPVNPIRPEKCSDLNAGGVVGREDDSKTVVDKLLDPDVERDVSFLCIEGGRGVGKTTLSQLVYNDPKITSAFPVRKWICVNCGDRYDFDVKAILGDALGLNHQGFTKDQMEKQLREDLARKRFLLVLDDVLLANHVQWFALESCLIEGERGSWVVVTTHSDVSARIIDGQVYELQGLSEKNSWLLFKRTAFGFDNENPPMDLIEIGQGIVRKIGGNPLALRVTASLLYGQDKKKWRWVEDHLNKSRKTVMSILRLSYRDLTFPLRVCFSYCALFPRNSTIEKETLISLWMAQGYIIPLREGQTLDDAAEEYFSILLHRYFLQHIDHNEYGYIHSCKMHDLMHDLAHKAARGGISLIHRIGEDTLQTRARHVLCSNEVTGSEISMRYDRDRGYIFKRSLHSYLYGGLRDNSRKKMRQSHMESLLQDCVHLRALSLSNFGIEELPSSIGGLMVLRYLDLSHNADLKFLPASITELYNLQSLKLKGCTALEKLPENMMNRLVNLRYWDFTRCYGLIGIRNLICLHALAFLEESKINLSWKEWFDDPEDISDSRILNGFLEVKINLPESSEVVQEDSPSVGLYPWRKRHISFMRFTFCGNDVRRRWKYDEDVMERTQVHSKLKGLEIRRYHGTKMPNWVEGNLANSVPYLVELRFSECPKLKYLACLHNLRHLKVLHVSRLLSLEYIDNSTTVANLERSSFFPSLKKLEFEYLPKLKGWWQSTSTSVSMEALKFPELDTLVIQHCPNLISLLQCPKLENLSLKSINKRLRTMTSQDEAAEETYTHCLDILKKLKCSFEAPKDLVILSNLNDNFEVVSRRSAFR